METKLNSVRNPSPFNTVQFYEWEKRGRGWEVYDHLVDLEPPFEPFFFHTNSTPSVDDGKKHTVFSFVATSILNALSPKRKEVESTMLDTKAFAAHQGKATTSLSIITVAFPREFKIAANEMEQFLIMLSSCQYPISFEIVANRASVRFQFVCREPDNAHVEGQLKAYFPACIIDRVSPESVCHSAATNCSFASFGLKEEFMRPIATVEKVIIDPLIGLLGIMEQLERSDTVTLQILFQGTVNPWAESILRSVTDQEGSSFFLDAPEMPKMATEKISAPLYAVAVRLQSQSSTEERAEYILDRVSHALVQMSRSKGNMLVELSNENYPKEKYLQDFEFRESHLVGMLLNAKELGSFVRFPTDMIVSAKLERDAKKTKGMPPIAEGHRFILGHNIHNGIEKIASLEPSMRLRHMHVIGSTGTGKSTLLQSCIIQDILMGNGIAVLDPHGDLIEGILPFIPEHRFKDVILIDPADSDFPVGFNILTAHSDVEKEILASDLVAVFRRLSTSFGDQMHSVLANAILAFLESSTGGTLIDLRRFLIEKKYREEFLKTVADPNVTYYWKHEFPLLKTSSIGPILTRLDAFLRPKVIRNMVAQKRSLNFEDILNTQKILFIKLSQGLIGAENSYLLGTFFVSKIYQAAMARQAQAKAERRDFFLYVDEFQNFITPSMSSILSGTRKYGLGCILAHQDLVQLQKFDTELTSAIISNAGTRVCFRLGDIDAKRLESGFSSFDLHDVQNLGIGEAIVRIERPEYDFSLVTIEIKEVTDEEREVAKNSILSISREKYATPRGEVEKSFDYLRAEQPKPEMQIIEVPNKEIQKAEQPVLQAPIRYETKEIKGDKTKERLIRQKEVSQHRYLQTLIKKMAEVRGYKALIEEPTPDGQGRVDVLLEKNGKRIACEIGVTTTKEWETHNVEKCLQAGYEVVIAVAINKEAVGSMQNQLLGKFSPELSSKVFVMEADTLFCYLDTEIAKEATTETKIKGYRVKVEYDTVSPEILKEKREVISKAVLDAKSRKK